MCSELQEPTQMHSTIHIVRMITISRNKIPGFLKDGSFYESLDKQDEGEFEIPENCYKENCDIDIFQDLNLLLNVARFWGLFELPVVVFEFIIENGCVNDYNDLLHEFPELKEYLQNVLAIKKTDFDRRVPEAIMFKFGRGVVTWLHQHGSVLTAEAAESAALVDDFDSLMYLYTHNCPWDERTTTAAAINRNVGCLLFALRLSCPVHSTLMNQIAMKGYVDVLKVLHSEGIPWDESTITAAIQGMNVNCVRFLHENGCTLPISACTDAVFNSSRSSSASLDLLRYLHEQGGQLDTYTAKYAAWRGNLPCLVYLHTHGCPWDSYATRYAAGGGYLDCLVYLHTQGCPWDETTITYAVSGGYWQCAYYAIRHGCPWYATLRVGSGFIVLALNCIVAFFWPNSNGYYDVSKIALSVLDCIKEVYSTYRRAYQIRQILLGSNGSDTWLDTLYGYLQYVRTPISMYFLYINLLFIYAAWNKVD